MPDDPKAEPESDHSASTEPLSMPQRVIAGIAGAGGLGAGGVSVFMTSNQAGSVALLGVGAIFLTVAVNGAPVIGAKFKDYELRMAEVRRKVVEKASREEPEEAIRTLDVLEEIDPASRNDPAVAAMHGDLYVDEIGLAVRRVLAEKTHVAVVKPILDVEADLVVEIAGMVVNVVAKYTTRGPDAFMMPKAIKRVFEAAESAMVPYLIITNARIPKILTSYADTHDPEHKKVHVVRWQDRRDDRALALGLRRLGVDID